MSFSARTPEALLAAVAQFDVVRNPKYQRRDITGDGKPETFCNQYLEDLLFALGLVIPAGLLAHYQLYWLDSAAGRAMGWEECSEERAVTHASFGLPVVAGWFNPDGHSHVALCVPTPVGRVGPFITQAGRHNFACEAITRGFGHNKVTFHFHG